VTTTDAGRKAPLFWAIVAPWVLVDAATKAWAVAALTPPQVRSVEVWGEWLRFTLVYNRGAAFGLHVGDWSRWIFTVLTLGALVLLWRLYVETAVHDRLRLVAVALVTGGALGNLVDRLRWARGVVDFIDVGLAGWRFWTFNVADIGVSCGAVLLAIVLWREDAAARAAQPAADGPVRP
jgi:signal peptidase II